MKPASNKQTTTILISPQENPILLSVCLLLFFDKILQKNIIFSLFASILSFSLWQLRKSRLNIINCLRWGDIRRDKKYF